MLDINFVSLLLSAHPTKALNDTKKIKTKTVILNKKDMILLISGGHGFKVLKKLEMLEIKQGPFVGEKDKIRLEKL